ncbi:T9SS type A sorting domain-containing protein [Chryseobacterium culicis]|uniref:T9SS type A sorting domain-containing protein n=1 Tax=Chryseobacterium culicis TaxID=680127 RepID=UPI0025872C69|nr:T9SS type A sorting domain-containing protein [Chryseobacterium culicis]
MKKLIPALSFFLIGILAIRAQTPINASLKETNFFPGSEPKGLLQVGNNLIFAANTGSGIEPHKYNLQTQTAEIVQNINGSFTDSMLKSEFYQIGNKVCYFASDNSNLQLWSTDLTTNSTSKVKDFNTYYPSSNNIIAKVLNGKLYFIFQQNLYISDGTSAGTFQVSNIYNIGNSLQESNGYVFFFGTNSIYGRELWKTDGTLAGTTLVKDIIPGPYSSITFSEKLYSFNNRIVFAARDSNFNVGLWSTDGTDINTENFSPLSPNATLYDFDFTNYGHLLFKVNGDLWKTDGTAPGTTVIYNNIPNIHKLTYFKNNTYIDTDTGIFFVDQIDQVNTLGNPSGSILQTISPSNNGNYLALKEYNNDASNVYFFDGNSLSQSNIKFNGDNKFIEYQNKLVFSGYMDSYVDYYTTYKNTELFSYDPASTISKVEKDLIYSGHGAPRFYTELNGEVYFLARDGYYYQVYKVDSNSNMTKLSSDLREPFPDNFADYNPVAVSGNYIYFHSNKLVQTNTTTNTVQQISPPLNEKIYGTYSLNNDKILVKTFNLSDNYMRMWSLDNNTANFTLLVEKTVSNFPSSINNVDIDFAKTDSGIYFKMLNNSTTEIWKSDGTAAGTLKITDLYNIYALNSFLSPVNDKVFFSDSPNFGNNTKLYYIDDMTNQVNLVKDSYSYINGKSFVKNNKLYFFSATNNGFITALNVTDGTPQNTQMVTQINSDGAYIIKKCGNFDYFVDYQRQKLFRTDGTAAGSILAATGTQGYSNFNCINNELYGISSLQKVFKTNGNPGNYQELSFAANNQVLQQPNYLWIRSLFTHNSKMYFSADLYNTHGEELFITDQINTLGTREEGSTGNDKIVIYPNPASTEVNIKLSNQERIVKVVIYDINGRQVSTHNTSLINVQNIPSGIYILDIVTNLRKHTSKLIKK